MGCTAGTDIIARDLHNADRSVNLLLAAVWNLHQFFLRGPCNLHRQIPGNRLIGPVLDHPKLFSGNHAVKIHGYSFTAKMESHIIQLKMLMDQSGNNMLTCMLLHIRETLLPVHGTCHCITFPEGLLHPVINDSVLLQHLLYRNIIEGSFVTALTALFREKHRLIQCNLIQIPLLLTG